MDGDSIRDNLNAAEKVVQEGNNSSAEWIIEIKHAEKELEKFHEQGSKINKKFLDDRGESRDTSNRYNLFTTNTQILISTLYARFPKPIVTREFEDQDDDVARVASSIIERLLKIKERDDFDYAMQQVVQDRLVVGLGQVWFRYEPTIVSEPAPPDPMTGLPPIDPMTQQPQMFDRLVNEEVITDYVHWRDFLWSPCKVWQECRWVGRRVKMTKPDIEKRFGPEISGVLNYAEGKVGPSNNADKEENRAVKYADIYEIWDKTTRTRFWIAKEYPTILDTKPDPFELNDFWPCPRPLHALVTTSSTVPKADYLLIQDQYRELDDVNDRITKLESAVKVVGVYDKTSAEIGLMLDANSGNKMIPADNFSQFSEKGGIKGMVDWLPLDQVMKAIQGLREHRADLVNQIYELTGISDIMRGSSKASETLGAQQLKAQYGSVRLQFLQMEVASFVEAALTIKSIMQLKMFQPETILQRSNIVQTPDKDLVQPAMQLLADKMLKYRVQVHADTMAVPEFNAERDARMQYVRAISEFLQGATPLMQMEPGSAPFLLEIMKWSAASFRTGRDIESVLDKGIAALVAKAQQPPPPPPPPNPLDVAKAQNLQAGSLKTMADAQGKAIENNVLKAQTGQLFSNPQEVNEPTRTAGLPGA